MMGEHICNGSGSDRKSQRRPVSGQWFSMELTMEQVPPTFEAEEAPQESYGFQAAFKSWRKPGPLDTGAASKLLCRRARHIIGEVP